MVFLFFDETAAKQVLGNLLINNELLEDTNFPLSSDFFSEDRLSAICYSTIYNLYKTGLKEINIVNIEDYLKSYPAQEKFYYDNNGTEYLQECQSTAQKLNYKYYYEKLKKYSILKMYKQLGFNISELYNPNETDITKKQRTETLLDSLNSEEISDYFSNKIEYVKSRFIYTEEQSVEAGFKLKELIQSFKEEPEYGLGLDGDIFNTITRGARKRKLYFRSMGSGLGKTRTLAANATRLSVGTYYSTFEHKWVTTNHPQSCLYITSEQEYSEIQTLVLSYVSGISEDKILDGVPLDLEEQERLNKAIDLIEKSKLIITPIGDYGIKQLVSLIRRKKYSDNIQYVFHDYVHSSLTLLNEISGDTRVSNLREDQVLLMLCNALKNLCNELDIFIFTATQLNRNYKEDKAPDATTIRGSLAIADKADFLAITLNISQEELELARKILASNPTFGAYEPNIVTHVSKNRRNKYTNLRLFSYFDRSVCQIKDLFALDYQDRPIDIKATKIIQKQE